MKKMIAVGVIVASVIASAGIVEETKSQPVLAGTAQIAPFGDVTQKVTSLGTLIGNPIVPTLLLTSGQQQLVEKYGRLRADAPITWFAYVQMPAWEIAATNVDQVAIEDMLEIVLVYPSVDGPANLVLKHPGATKAADGTIHLLPSEDNPNDVYVRYTADNRYCSFAASAAMAARGLADFAAQKNLDAKRAPLVKIEVTERGMAAIATLCEAFGNEQRKTLAEAGTNKVELAQMIVDLQAARRAKTQKFVRSIASCVMTLDLDKNGLSLDTRLSPKPGQKTPLASSFVLPAGALDRVPNSAPLFLFGGDRLLIQTMDEASFRDNKACACALLPALVDEFARKDDSKKYTAFLKEVARLISQLLADMPFPSANDWTGVWLAFDGAQHPYCEQVNNAAQADVKRKLAERIDAGLIAAVEKQWPGKGLLAKTERGIVFDWHALIDLFGAEAGVKPNDKEAKALANAKRNVATILGSGKTAISATWNGNDMRALYAAPEVKPLAEAQPAGEARVAAALPETVAKRPAEVLYLEFYSLVRESVLPIMAKIASKKDAKQYKTMIAAMTPAEENSALAYACWVNPNGAVRALLRITANELKNLGSAFNAFTAASLVGAGNE